MNLHEKGAKNISALLTNVIEKTLRENYQKTHGARVRRSILLEDDNAALEKGDVTSDDVIEKLNTIRAGRSFKDEGVKKTMDEYVQSLSDAEKTALLAFLKGISQVVTGEVAAKDIADPSEKPAEVEIKRAKQGKKVVHIQPNVIKTQIPKTKETPSSEDTSGPVPITPKKK